MAIKKKSGGGGGGANWMDTYGDMVTLLMCFFVLLYSMSTISEDKFRALVQSFNPSALEQSNMVSGTEGPLADESEGIGSEFGLQEPEEAMEEADIEAALAALAEMMQQMAQDSGQAQNIDVATGEGYVFISFNNAVFFRGDSYRLEAGGQDILNIVAEGLNQASPYIDELRIMGHTAQGDPNRPNNAENDRILSADRAAIVAAYLQTRTRLSPARIVTMGFGQWRPVAPNDSPGGRAANRRVEMIITGLDLYSTMGDSLEQYATYRTGGSDSGGAAPEGAEGAV
ncbi:MAG: flagellar motor protein MotB [Oscillibacter sp.]|nr:flagellar motor protein MotB [Oscillibacter sp.]